METKTALKVSVFVAGHPVSVNAAYGQRGSRRFLTSAAETWKSAVSWTVYAALPDTYKGYLNHLLPRPRRIAVAYRFRGVRGDADNYIKLTQDAIASAMRVNDKTFQVASATVEPGTSGVWLEIQEIDERNAEKAQVAG